MFPVNNNTHLLARTACLRASMVVPVMYEPMQAVWYIKLLVLLRKQRGIYMGLQGPPSRKGGIVDDTA